MVLATVPVFIVMFFLIRDPITESGEINPWLYILGLILAPIFPAILSFAYSNRLDNVGGDVSTATPETD